MLRLTAERRASAKTPGAPTGHPSITTKDIGVSHSSSKAHDFNVAALRKRRAYVRANPHPLVRGLCFALLFEAVAVVAIVGACYLIGYLLHHPAYCWIVIGFGVLAGMAGMRKEGLL